jgi:hypothetical protein
MRELTTLRLLPLCGLVAFPGTPPIAASVPSNVAIDAPVGLLHCRRDKSLASVGSLARSSSSIGSTAVFEAFERFRVVEYVSDDEQALVVRYEPHVDAPFTSAAQEAEAKRLHEDLWEKLMRIEELSQEGAPGSRALPQLAELQPGLGSPSDFSLALAGSVELDEAKAQHLLECVVCVDRLRILDEVLSESLSFRSAQAALSRLGL